MKSMMVKILGTAVVMLTVGLALANVTGCSSKSDGTQGGDPGLISLEKDCLGKEIEFATPESFIFDSASGCYFISNIDGDPMEKADNGFIIKLDGDFKLVDNYFIAGSSDDIVLNAPKGMAVVDTVLYVTDIDAVRAFSSISGRHLADYDFSFYQPKFLNDIAADNAGNLYISAMLTDRIFKIDDSGQLSIYLSITAPNGLLYHPDGHLYAAGWEEAKVVKILPGGSLEDIIVNEDFKNLDGLDIDKQGRLYFSDFNRGIIYRYDAVLEKLDTLITGLDNPADISVDRKNNLLLIPRFASRCCVKLIE